MKKSFQPFFGLLLTVAVCASCEKEPPARPGNPSSGELKVRLSGDYLSVDGVDSAIAIWESGGRKHTVRMAASAGYLVAEMKSFAAGNGRLTVQLYTQTKLGGKPLQWELQQSLSLSGSSALAWNGPSGIDDSRWMPRVILDMQHPAGGISVTTFIALRPEDPYFGVRGLTGEYTSAVSVERQYYAADGSVVSGGTWDCRSSCTDEQGHYEDRSFFTFLGRETSYRPHKRVMVEAAFRNSAGSAWAAHFDYTY